MRVSLVRHGETGLNARFKNQSPETPLSDKGRRQAACLGEHLVSLQPDAIITSDLNRAAESAFILGKHTDLAPVEREVFREIRRPKELFEYSHMHPRSILFMLRLALGVKEPAHNAEKEENLADIRTRVERGAEYLESFAKDHDHIVVVSHALYINLFVAHVCHQQALPLYKYAAILRKTAKIRNTSITHLEYTKTTTQTCPWTLIEWNNHKHLESCIDV